MKSVTEKIEELAEQLRKEEAETSIMNREQKAERLVELGHVDIINENMAFVKSEAGTKTYTVNHTLGICECPDHKYRGESVICAHRLAVKLQNEHFSHKSMKNDDLLYKTKTKSELVLTNGR